MTVSPYTRICRTRHRREHASYIRRSRPLPSPIESYNYENEKQAYACQLMDNKKAELSQRRPRDAPNIWVHWVPTATFPVICNGLLFRSILRMCLQNWKFVALPVPEIIGGTLKIRKSLDKATPLSPKSLKGFCSDGSCEYTC